MHSRNPWKKRYEDLMGRVGFFSGASAALGLDLLPAEDSDIRPLSAPEYLSMAWWMTGDNLRRGLRNFKAKR